MGATGRAAVLWGLAGLGYLTAEGVAAGAFPGYSYARNYISDLGIPDRVVIHGRVIDSPLAEVMAAGFVLQGVLFAAAVVVLHRPLRADRRYPVLVALALVHGAGNLLVALIPSTTPGPLHALHPAGAGLAIVGGNLAVLLAGRLLRPVPLLGPAGAVLAVVGLAALAGLVLGGTPPGLWERGSVYAITLWEVLAAGVLIRPTRTGCPPPPGRGELGHTVGR